MNLDLNNKARQYGAALIALILCVVGYFIFRHFKESDDERLTKIYQEMRDKTESARVAIHDKYFGKGFPEEFVIAEENTAISIMQSSPEFKLLNFEAKIIETKAPLPFMKFTLWALAAILSAIMVALIIYLSTHINFGLEKYLYVVTDNAFKIWMLLFAAIITLLAVG
jgi:hypothetical protein